MTEPHYSTHITLPNSSPLPLFHRNITPSIPFPLPFLHRGNVVCFYDTYCSNMMQWWLKCSLNSKRELIRSQSRSSCSTLSTLTCEKLEKPAAIANTPVLNGPRQLSHSLANFHTPLPTFTHTHTLTFTLTSHKKCVFFP